MYARLVADQMRHFGKTALALVTVQTPVCSARIVHSPGADVEFYLTSTLTGHETLFFIPYVSLQLVSLCERLWALFAFILPLFVVLVELVFVEVEAGDKVHGADAAVEVAHLVDLLHVVPQLLLIGEHSLAKVALLAEHRLLLKSISNFQLIFLCQSAS